MKRVLIVQARMTSTRLPGKVLADVAGAPMLARQLERLARCQTVDQTIVATTTNASDDPVAELAGSCGVDVFRGDERDVLSRYVGAAREAGADVIVRVTADCPLIDPDVTDAVVQTLTEASAAADYASNLEPRTFPRGLDTEAFTIDTLRRLDDLAPPGHAREHVTIFAYRDRPDLFRRVSFVQDVDDSDLSWTVDTERDLDRVRRIYEALDLAGDLAGRWMPFSALVAGVRADPDLQ